MIKLGRVLAVVLLAGLLGCASQLNQVRLGMTQGEVIQVLGSPGSTSAMGNTVYLNYDYCSDWIFPNRYYVRLVDGKVDAFGRAGDFNLGY